ncbi:MAG: amino acid permease [Lachnospiraceae bacterium]|nr:amino acid permease [Lachnospiraceae bacterium]
MDTEQNKALSKYITPPGAFALAFGSSVGWGAFVMPGTTFLPIAGPVGTLIGITLGAIAMLVIASNYHYMINIYPEPGGAFAFARNTFGYDHGFLSAWYLMITYAAVIWANATALSLIMRYLVGDIFKFGFHYSIAGYDIYLGEALLSITALVVFGFLCIRGRRLSVKVQIFMAGAMLLGIFACMAVSFINNPKSAVELKPMFQTDGHPFIQVMSIAALSPWAFVGFESISNSAAEFKFDAKRCFLIMTLAVIAAAACYIALTEIASFTIPEEYGDWASYIAALSEESGIRALPTLNAVNTLMGNAGTVIFAITVIAAIVTGIIGNYICAGRLLYAMAGDDMLPPRFRGLAKNNSPQNAILFIMGVSCLIPFLGRTAMGWVVDVTTIGATIAYAYTSAAAFKCAREKENIRIMITGAAGFFISCFFSLYLLIPNIWSVTALSTESYLILAVWSILGIVYFKGIFNKDEKLRFGKTTMVWIAILFLVFFSTLMWIRQTIKESSDTVVENVDDYYSLELSEHGIEQTPEDKEEVNNILDEQFSRINGSLLKSSAVQMALILLALYIIFDIYSTMQKRESEAELERNKARADSRAKSNFMSNMSRDIRTPLNAILGYTTLAKKEDDIPEKTMKYLKKIENSERQLIALVNDMVDMSKIEKGKLKFNPSTIDIEQTVLEVRDMFVNQMEDKNIDFRVNIIDVKDRWVRCDKGYFVRILMNLLSNAWKFTPENGKVFLSLSETEKYSDIVPFEIVIKDTGEGMTEEEVEHLFDGVEPDIEGTDNMIQGMALGLVLTRNIVDLMGGNIRVESRKNSGTEFIINVGFLEDEEPSVVAEVEERNQKGELPDFAGMRLLMAEDNAINKEIATLILTEAGFRVEHADNGEVALHMVADSAPGYYDAVLMDIQMPVMNGYDATKGIRALKDKALSSIPIIAMTADAFTEDVKKAESVGMNGHISKPLDIPAMMKVLTDVLG